MSPAIIGALGILSLLALLFVRGEGRAPGSPASDGAVILLAGGLAGNSFLRF